jgi:hypothetical protein
MPRHNDRWGISEAYFVAIGQINIAFQRLDWGLGYTVFLLSGVTENVTQCVNASMSAGKLEQIAELFKSRISQFGERREGLCDMFDAAHLACVNANKARNGIIHAHWGFNTQFQLVVEDLKGKAPGLPIIKNGGDSPAELFAIVEQIEQANRVLMDFCGLFAAVYHHEYVRGYASGDAPE